MNAMLEVDNVSRRFGGLMAVDNVTTAVGEGELIGLIGPNGAGKTTLFNLISGFTPVSSGEIRYRGKKISGLKPSAIADRGISRTFQNLRVFPNMTVFDNVSVGAVGAIGQNPWQAITAGSSRSKAISERSWEALEQVKLTEYANDLAANLAYGKRKYLEIGRALAMKPDLLILDEPAAGLNDSETAELAAFIKDLHSQGLTVMLVEHDMGLVMNICERIVVLASGRKIADAEPALVRQNREVLEAYLGVDDE